MTSAFMTALPSILLSLPAVLLSLCTSSNVVLNKMVLWYTHDVATSSESNNAGTIEQGGDSVVDVREGDRDHVEAGASTQTNVEAQVNQMDIDPEGHNRTISFNLPSYTSVPTQAAWKAMYL